MAIPAPGRPSAVSRTCVVSRPIPHLPPEIGSFLRAQARQRACRGRKTITRFCDRVTRDYSETGSKHYKASLEGGARAGFGHLGFMLHDEALKRQCSIRSGVIWKDPR